MKTLIAKSAYFLPLLAALFLLTAAAPSDAGLAKWKMLGSRTVNYKLDKDQITVTFKKGTFNAVKFKVKRGGLNMHRCTIYFANGDRQNVALKRNYSPNSSSRTIDLQGNNRVISKVVFWYDSKNNRPVKSVLQLWGRH